MIKVLMIFGTRPEAIKMAPLVLEMQKYKDIECKICLTGQHREMLDQVMDIFSLKADFDLNIMEKSQTLTSITCKILTKLDELFAEYTPDIVLVHGDTTTTFAGSLAAFYKQIPVGHVEAGLRTFDKYSPFPEELNRGLTGTIANMHFCPTQNNANNLENEKKQGEIYITGNTVIDALKTTICENYEFKADGIKNINFEKKLVLVTAHRRENYGEPFENILSAIRDLANEYKSTLEFVYPVHLSPYVREQADKYLSGLSNVHLIPPVTVDDMHNLMGKAYMIMTDSGGIQEEAPSLGKPVLVLRAETERPEAVLYGTVKIAGNKYDTIYESAKELIENKEAYEKMSKAANPYGDGLASKRICEAILYHFGKSKEKPQDFKV